MSQRASKLQLDAAKKLNIEIECQSFDIAAAQIEAVVLPIIRRNPRGLGPATEKQINYAKSLGVDVSKDTVIVASARIQDRQDKRNKRLIRQMRLAPEKVVYWRRLDRKMVISSIASNGRLWFKGGNGYGAFPHEVEIVDTVAPPSRPPSAKPDR